jgi:5-methylcytosine-specific restriction endonuclease McrA
VEQYCGQPVHIDHIIPLSSAKTEDKVKKLCHYSNLQLLKPKDNLEKQVNSDYIYVKRS